MYFLITPVPFDYNNSNKTVYLIYYNPIDHYYSANTSILSNCTKGNSFSHHQPSIIFQFVAIIVLVQYITTLCITAIFNCLFELNLSFQFMYCSSLGFDFSSLLTYSTVLGLYF